MVGRKASMEQSTDTHPYWRVIAILDHSALHGQIFRHDDPIWATIYPPNGFNCRCRVIALSEAAVKRRGLTVITSEGRTSTETVETGTHKHTGEIRTATVTAVRLTNPQGHTVTFRTDPGFNHAPGAGLVAALKQKEAAAKHPSP
nr:MULTISPECIES: phage minor head protein [unclassified Pseudomonas]